MTNICPGIFKKAFEKPGFSFNLACQLTTGADTFNYMIPSDPTLYSSDNNLFSTNVQWDGATNSSSYTWIGSDWVTGLAMNRSAWYNRTPSAIPDAEPALTISTNVPQSPIMIGKSFVAQNGSPWDIQSIMGGTHIKLINGVKYITSYRLYKNNIDSWSWTIRLQKHQVIYDPNIDQSTITDMPLVDSIILDNATHGNMTIPRTPESHPLGTSVKQANWSRENRQMTCNRDGTQTIFSVARDTNDSENYNIFVLTDDDNGFSVELYDVFYKSETLESNTAETINYTGSGTQDSTVEYQCQSGSYSPTGSTTKDLTVSESYNSNSITTGIDYELEFMGAAFNKFTDEIIVAVKKTVNGQYDGDISGMPIETTTTWSKNITNNCTDGDNVSSTNSGSHSHNSVSHTIDALQTTLLINNIPLGSMVLPYYHHEENLSGEGGDFISADCPNTPTAKGASTSSQSTSFGEFVELRIVDLSMLVFLLQFNETTDVRAGSTQDTYNYENYYLVTNDSSQLVKSELVTEYHYPYTGSGSTIFKIDISDWDYTSSGNCDPPPPPCSGSEEITRSCSTSFTAPDTP